MKAEDLRIGNWVNQTSQVFKEEPHTVVRILDLADLQNKHCRIFCEWEDVEPIPLNEDWLLKFGFESKKFKEIHSLSKKLVDGLYVCFHFDAKGKIKGQWFVVDEYETDMGIIDEQDYELPSEIFVHDLQNWYYTTTKLLRGKAEELKIKEDD